MTTLGVTHILTLSFGMPISPSTRSTRSHGGRSPGRFRYAG